MDLHLTLHNHEKTLALYHRLEGEQKKLEAIQNKQRQLREKLYKAKLDRSKIRKDIKDLSYNGGLVALPMLMHDYDRTLELVAEKQLNINQLKQTVKGILQRIAEYEARCT